MFRSTLGSRRFRHRSLLARKLRFESLESKFLLDARGLVLSLDQCGSYASVNDNSAFDLGMNDGEDFTIEATFFVPTSSLDNLQRIISHGSQYLLAIDFNSDQPDSVQFTTTPNSQVSAQASIGAGWHHIAAVFNNETGMGGDYRALFLDGSLLISDASIQYSTGVSDTTAQLRIGASDAPFGFDTYFNGFFDEVRLSNSVRYSDATYEIPTMAFGVDPTTRALWHFDDSIGATGFIDSVSGHALIGQGGAHTAEPTWERATVVDIFGPYTGVTFSVSVAAVTFSEPIDPSTFDFSDIQLASRVGISNPYTNVPLNNSVTRRLVSGSTFLIEGLDAFTNSATSPTTYRLVVNADNVSAVSGHSAGGCVAQYWTKNSTGFQPEITVLGNNLEIADGDVSPRADDLTQFEDIPIGESSDPHTFTIRSAVSFLHLTGIPRILIGGPNASDFVVTVQPAATISPNQTTTFQVVFSPSGAGSRAAEIFILNDDSNESLYNFVVQGTGTPANPSPTGDYNLNGTVDAADFVLWRKAEGSMVAPFSGADGSGNGIVDQADYGIWRANFGNTLPPPGSGSAATLAVTAAEPVAPKAVTEAVPTEQATTAKELTGTRQPLSSRAGSVVHTPTARSGGSRALRRDLPFVAASHENELIARLATRLERPRRDESALDFAELRNKQVSGDALGQLDNALDVVFASFGE